MTGPAVLQVGGGSATNVVVFPSPTTPGSTLFVLVTDDGVSTGTYDTSPFSTSDTWFSDGEISQTNPIANENLQILRCPSCIGGSTNYTLDLSSSSGVINKCIEVSGLDGSTGPIVTTLLNTSPSNTPNQAFDTGNAGTVPAGSFLIGGVIGVGSGGRGTATPSGSWTNETPQQPGSASSLLLSHKITGSSGPAEFSGSFSVNTYWSALVAAYQPVGGGGGPVAPPSQLKASGII